MNDLIRLVKKMRALQKRFFDGDKSVLSASKKAERAVDAEITRLERGDSFLPGMEKLEGRGPY
jgi:hypothetical protein